MIQHSLALCYCMNKLDHFDASASTPCWNTLMNHKQINLREIRCALRGGNVIIKINIETTQNE